MRGPTITGVSGYVVQPDITTRLVTAGAALSQGDPVIWNTTTNYDGHTVIACAANTFVVGVCMADAASGEKVKIQVKGDIASGCGFVTTDEGVTAGQGLIPGTAVADSGAIATAAGTGFCFGYAAAADAGTVLSSGYLMCFE